MTTTKNNQLNVTYNNVLNNNALRTAIETQYIPSLPQFPSPIHFSGTFDYENPDYTGYLASIIIQLISIFDAKPSLSPLSIMVHSYSNLEFIHSSIIINLKPEQTIDYETAKSIANNIQENWDNTLNITVIPNPNTLVFNISETF